GYDWAAEARVALNRWARLVGCLIVLVVLTLWVPAVENRAASPPTRDRLIAQGRLSALPFAAHGVVSATLGANDPAYRIRSSGAGFAAQNPAQHLQIGFSGSSVRLADGHARIELALRAWGYGSSPRTVGPVRPSARANGVTYSHSGLTEWYRNGPL